MVTVPELEQARLGVEQEHQRRRRGAAELCWVAWEEAKGLDKGQLFAKQIARERLDETGLPHGHVELFANDPPRCIGLDAFFGQIHRLGHLQGLLDLRFGEVQDEFRHRHYISSYSARQPLPPERP